MKFKKFVVLFFIIAFSSLAQSFAFADNLGDLEDLEDLGASEQKNDNPYKMSPFEEVTSTDTQKAVINQKSVYFENGDYYWFRRYIFKDNSNERVNYAISLAGNFIEIRFVDPVSKQWVLTSDLSKIKDVKNTLFINTDMNSMVISIPAVYKNIFSSNTLEVLAQDEYPLSITHSDGLYNISFSFPNDSSKIGEIWGIQSKNKLIDWTDQSNYNYLKVHDLALERRWSWDGYYFKTPYNYIPGGENVLYRHPANYTGSSFAKYGNSLAAIDLGFIMTNVCLKNQNRDGFWATGPASQWLQADFQINGNFYDTRFSTDFAISLIFAFKRYQYQPFLDGAVKYAEYFLNHAAKHHYDINDGWLVEDYAPDSSQDVYTRTHSSLNHHVNEMVFLYYLYNETKDSRYYETADKMLKAIDYTKDKWVLPDGNLNYALMYTGTNNTMVDYPYLTYNDLFELKSILSSYGIQNNAVNYLMESKKSYMDKNNITDYRK